MGVFWIIRSFRFVPITKPLFLERFKQHINHYHFETRMELARSAPQAVTSLSFLGSHSLSHKEVRQCCNDIIALHGQYTKHIPGKSETIISAKNPADSPRKPKPSVATKAKNGNVLDNFGNVLAQFGVVLDKNGNVKDTFGNTNTPKNHVFSTKNPHIN